MVDLLNISLIRCFLLQTLLGHYLCSMLIAFSTAGPRTFLWIFEAIFEAKYEQYLGAIVLYVGWRVLSTTGAGEPSRVEASSSGSTVRLPAAPTTTQHHLRKQPTTTTTTRHRKLCEFCIFTDLVILVKLVIMVNLVSLVILVMQMKLVILVNLEILVNFCVSGDFGETGEFGDGDHGETGDSGKSGESGDFFFFLKV